MGCFHPRDAQALLSLIRHHIASFSAPSGHFVQRIVLYLSFQFSYSCVLRFLIELLA